MKCVPFQFPPDARGGIVCGVRKERPKPCVECFKPSTRLCDFPLGRTKTCSKALCDKCAKKRGNLDYCPQHDEAIRVGPRQLALFSAPVKR